MSALAAWFRRRVAEAMQTEIVIGGQDEALIAIVGRMRVGDADCAVIVDAAGCAVGILDARDILRRVVFETSPDQPVSGIQVAAPSVVRVDDPLYLAIAAMVRDSTATVVALDSNGRPQGILRRDGAFEAACGSVLDVLARAGHTGDVAGLALGKAAQPDVAAALMADHQPASVAVEFINAANFLAVGRLSEITCAGLDDDGWGAPPVPFAVIVMGSAGRGESLLAPDQDNGLIIADDPAQDRSRIDGFFVEFARRLTRDLAAVGFPLCPGEVMASNRAWRKTLAAWRAQIDDWASARTNIAILNADIFFDFRCVYGERTLAADLRRHVTRVAQGNGPFLNQMAWRQSEEGPSVGLFGRVVGRDMQDDGVDLKLHGTMPLVEAVRLLSLWAGIEETGTRSRLAALLSRRVIERADHDELADAFEFLTGLLLRRQVAEALAKRPAGEMPAMASPHERERLVETLRRIDSFRRTVTARLLGPSAGAGL